MKLESLFKSEKNKLYTVEGKEVLLADCKVLKAETCFAEVKNNCVNIEDFVCKVEVPWALVGTEESGYNEEALASLRDWLKLIETKNQFAIIVPVAENNLSIENKNTLTASMKHCARRIKDCVSVVGFSIPSQFDSSDAKTFMEELSAKHAQYVFFSNNKSIFDDEKIVSL